MAEGVKFDGAEAELSENGSIEDEDEDEERSLIDPSRNITVRILGLAESTKPSRSPQLSAAGCFRARFKGIRVRRYLYSILGIFDGGCAQSISKYLRLGTRRSSAQ